MYADYADQTYRCSMSMGRHDMVKLLSNTPQTGFKHGLTGYVKQVKKTECDRVFKKELCFKYMGDSFLVDREGDGMYLLKTGPRSYDLTAMGFIKKNQDTYIKLVKESDGELYWNETEY